MIRLGIAAESWGDAELATELVDRLLVAEIDWVEPGVLDAYRTWAGVDGGSWLDLHHTGSLARDRGLRIYGQFQGEPGAFDARLHRTVLLLFATCDEPPQAVVICRDLDDQPERRQGFEQALADRQWPFAVIGALAQPEIEAWRIAAWSAESDGDRQAHGAVRQRLGFDPTAAPERLSSGRQADKKDAKRVLSELCAAGRSPTERWADTAFAEPVLVRGQRCGLTDFLSAIRETIVPLVRGFP